MQRPTGNTRSGRLPGPGHPAIETALHSRSRLARPLTDEEVKQEGLDKLKGKYDCYWDWTHTLTLIGIRRAIW